MIKAYLPFNNTTASVNPSAPEQAPLPISPDHPVHLRLRYDGSTYAIAMYIRQPYRKPNERPSDLYLKIRSKAIAHYCLFGHAEDKDLKDDLRFDAKRKIRYLDIATAEDYSAIRLRLRRCGAVQIYARDLGLIPSVIPDSLFCGGKADNSLAEHLAEEWKYIFAFPHPRQPLVNDGAVDDTKNPVWVYRNPTYWQTAIPEWMLKDKGRAELEPQD